MALSVVLTLPHGFQTARGPTQASYAKSESKAFFLWIKQPESKLNNSHLVPRLRMRGDIPPCTYLFME
jgi:hypothetical protein